MQVNIELEELSSQALCELISSSASILKGRLNLHIDYVPEHKPGPIEEKPEKKHKRGPYKTKKKEKESRKDFTVIDKIIKEHHGKKNSTKMIAMAAKKGIKTNKQQIKYRRKILGLPAINLGRSKKEKTEQENPRKRKKRTTDFIEIDKTVKEYYGKKSAKEMVIILGLKHGIKTDEKQIDYRRRALGLSPKKKKDRSLKEVKKKVKEQTEEEDLKLIEEASNINLKDLNKREESDIPEEEHDSVESYEH